MKKQIEEIIYTYSTDEVKVEQLEKLCDKLAIGFAEWLHSNTVYSGNGFYTSFIPKHNNCQFKLVQLLKYYKQTL